MTDQDGALRQVAIEAGDESVGLSGSTECASLLPCFDISWNDFKRRVGCGRLDRLESYCPFRIANPELRLQMSPLVLNLPARNGHPAGHALRADQVTVETVAASQRLHVHGSQVLRYGPHGRRPVEKPRKLGVVAVAARSAPQHGLRQQSLPPKRHEPARVEVLRVQTPDSHAVSRNAHQRTDLISVACSCLETRRL